MNYELIDHFEKYSLNADIILLLDGAFWILDVVLEGLHSISSLSVERLEYRSRRSGYDLSGEQWLEIDFNRPGHGLNERELMETFVDLSSNDLVSCDLYRGSAFGDPKPEPEKCMLDLETLKSLLDPENHDLSIYYGLTKKGGALWESITSPDWTLYISASATTFDDESDTDMWKCRAEGSDRALIERFISESSIAIPLDPGASVWTELSPWQATYWKTLPHGYRVDYTGKDAIEEIMSREANGKLTSAPEWYTSPLK